MDFCIIQRRVSNSLAAKLPPRAVPQFSRRLLNIYSPLRKTTLATVLFLCISLFRARARCELCFIFFLRACAAKTTCDIYASRGHSAGEDKKWFVCERRGTSLTRAGVWKERGWKLYILYKIYMCLSFCRRRSEKAENGILLIQNLPDQFTPQESSQTRVQRMCLCLFAASVRKCKQPTFKIVSVARPFVPSGESSLVFFLLL